jgi:WD40 repeat protein
VRLSPDGTTVALFEDATLLDYVVDPERLPIRLIDLATGHEAGALDGYGDYAADVAFSPDGTRLASRHANGELLLWDLSGATGELVGQFQTDILARGPIAFLPDGRTLAALNPSIPSWIQLIDTYTGARTRVIGPAPDTFAEFLEAQSPGPPLDFQIVAMEVSPDGTMIATSTLNDEVAIWSLESGEPRTLRPASERIGGLSIRQLAFSSGSESLTWFDASDGRTHAWDLATGNEIGSLELGGTPFAFSPDGAQLAWAERRDDQTAIGIGDMYGSIAPFDLAVVDGRFATGITSIDYTPDGKTIVLGGLFAPEGENAIHLVPAPW